MVNNIFNFFIIKINNTMLCCIYKSSIYKNSTNKTEWNNKNKKNFKIINALFIKKHLHFIYKRNRLN